MKRLMPLMVAIAALLFSFAPTAFSQRILTTIPAGGQPSYPAVNTTTNMIYVPNSVLGTVAVIDGKTDEVVADISLGGTPFAAAVNPITNRIYVTAGQQNGYVDVIDGSSNAVIATVPFVDASRVAVNSAANLIYVVTGKDLVSVLDGRTNGVIEGVTSDGCCMQSIAFSPITNRIYVTIIPHQLMVIDATTYKFTMLSFPQIVDLNMVVVDSTSNRVYLSDAGGTGVYVINGYTGELITNILPGYEGPIAVNPTNHLLADFDFSSVSESASLAFVNGQSYDFVGGQVKFPVGIEPMAIVPGVSNRYYMTFQNSGAIAVVAGPQP